MLRRRHGFTLIELLVVIAIIGILAAMLFPVFARAREAARKVQCLSNIKNIALAFQMYLTDYDRFPPNEHDQRVLDWLGDGCWIENEPNPYLRVPVILDEYIKNRDVWYCASGSLQNNFAINSCLPDWWTHFLNSPDLWCSRYICMNPYPPGWGGDVTDTNAQRQCGGAGDSEGGFKTNYATIRTNRDASTSIMGDAAKWVVVGECASNAERWHSYSFAYEACRIACEGETCGADWENCPDTRDCSPVPRGTTIYRVDATARKSNPEIRARHLGGNNIGFADGHAKWFESEAILHGGTAGAYLPAGNLFENLQNCRFPPVSEVP
jgi:prepilin-type N-terminal cleavage/methylation domain-containing protein/prepilin-type processing-associated H-X9-DG protein